MFFFGKIKIKYLLFLLIDKTKILKGRIPLFENGFTMPQIVVLPIELYPPLLESFAMILIYFFFFVKVYLPL